MAPISAISLMIVHAFVSLLAPTVHYEFVKRVRES